MILYPYRYLFDNIFSFLSHCWPQNVQERSGSVINCPTTSESGSVIQDYGFADPEEILTDQQHCLKTNLYVNAERVDYLLVFDHAIAGLSFRRYKST
jgi:hypothetical protein